MNTSNHGVGCIFHTITHHSAQAKCHRVKGSSLLHINYLGLVDQTAFNAISPRVRNIAGVDPTITRFDSALTFFPDSIIAPPYADTDLIGPGALVVRKDQESQSIKYCELLATFGIFRQTFLKHQQELAERWVALQVIRRKLAAGIRLG